MYHFVHLTDEQRLYRRHRLDWYGHLAQISVLVPLTVIWCFQLASWIQKQRRSQKLLQTSLEAQFERTKTSVLTRKWRNLVWWFSEPADIFGYNFGTKGVLLGSTVWAIWLLIISFVQTGDDYLHLAARFGIVGASQMPFLYLLSLKSLYSPLYFLTRQSYGSLISIHKHLGRIITILFYLHALLYVIYYISANLLFKKLTQLYIICGVFAIIAFIAIGGTTLKLVRNWSYRVFYVTHVVLGSTILPMLYFHGYYMRTYLWEIFAIYATHWLLRFFAVRTLIGTIKTIPSTKLVEIRISLPAAAERRSPIGAWQAGRYAYISMAGSPLLHSFRSNPFSVASVPSADGYLRFVARIREGNTSRFLSNLACPSQKLSIEGPYGALHYARSLLDYDKVLFVAGGVGGTFISPLYRQLLGDMEATKESRERQSVLFTWIARTEADISWGLPEDAEERELYMRGLSIYLTRELDRTQSGTDMVHASPELCDDQEKAGRDREQLDLEENKQLLSEERSLSKMLIGLPAKKGRPDLANIVDGIFDCETAGRVAVVFCGPESLKRDLHKEIGVWIGRGRECLWWAEEFGI